MHGPRIPGEGEYRSVQDPVLGTMLLRVVRAPGIQSGGQRQRDLESPLAIDAWWLKTPNEAAVAVVSISFRSMPFPEQLA
jgi:hypothetical protein